MIQDAQQAEEMNKRAWEAFLRLSAMPSPVVEAVQKEREALGLPPEEKPASDPLAGAVEALIRRSLNPPLAPGAKRTPPINALVRDVTVAVRKAYAAGAAAGEAATTEEPASFW